MRYTLKLLLLVLLSTNVVGQNKFPLVTDYYKLELSFDFEEEIIKGSCEITIQNKSDETINQIPVLLYRLMKIDSVQTILNKKLPFSQNVTQFEDFKKLQTLILPRFESITDESMELSGSSDDVIIFVF